MTWPWRNTDPAGAAAAPAPAPAPSLDKLIEAADLLRDARRWAEAAQAYEAVVERASARSPIWVQLGHARKESGDLKGAEAAYRQALALAPEIADTHVQLGHALKLQGARGAAIAAYARALRVDRTCTPALTELIALGEGWEAEQASEVGAHMLGDLLQATQQMRATLSRLEQALPDVASLINVPVVRYDLFQSRSSLPPPPSGEAAGPWDVIVLGRHGPDAAIALLRSLAGQTVQPASVTVVSDDQGTASAVRRFCHGGVMCPVEVVDPAQMAMPPSAGWVLVMDSASTLVPLALAWLAWAAAQLSADGYYMDEDHAPAAGDPGAAVAGGPVLKAAYDPEIDSPLYRHTAVALRGSFADGCVPGLVGAADPVQAMADAVAGAGGIGHLARILVRRTRPVPAAVRAIRATEPVDDESSRLGVIIPTRNGGAVLRGCLDALRATSARPERVDLVVLDNGSDDPATLALLEDLKASGSAMVIRDDAPFNWSRLNNIGVAACDSPLLLFLNDDVTITGTHWDSILRHHLARPHIGAVGARLVYPDGRLQHGGIVFGPGDRVEHEGRASIGVPDDIASRWMTRRRVAAVTGAFLACRRADFDAVAGFDGAEFPIWFNDIDFCLRLRQAGLAIVYDPALQAVHHESWTLSAQDHSEKDPALWQASLSAMRRRWGQALVTDPGFNPYFARTGRPFELMREPSPHEIQMHLVRSARPNPWRVD